MVLSIGFIISVVGLHSGFLPFLSLAVARDGWVLTSGTVIAKLTKRFAS